MQVEAADDQSCEAKAGGHASDYTESLRAAGVCRLTPSPSCAQLLTHSAALQHGDSGGSSQAPLCGRRTSTHICSSFSRRVAGTRPERDRDCLPHAMATLTVMYISYRFRHRARLDIYRKARNARPFRRKTGRYSVRYVVVKGFRDLDTIALPTP